MGVIAGSQNMTRVVFMTLGGVVTFREVGTYNFCLCDIVLSSIKFMFENYNQLQKHDKNMF